MKAVLIVIGVALLAKLVWNVVMPYAVLARKRDGMRHGVSLVPGVEIGLLSVAVAVAWKASLAWPSPFAVAVIGVTAIAGSYAHLLAVVAIAKRLRTQRPDPP